MAVPLDRNVRGETVSKTFWLGKLSISVGVNGRGYNGVNAPWFGFAYGSWLPRFSWNGGRFDRREVVDINWRWLFLHGSWTWWGN